MTEDAKNAPEANEEVPASTDADASDSKEFQFVEDPSFDVTDKGECAYEVKVSVPVANEHKLSEEVFEELQHEAEVPGFRRGRAPRKLIERKFAKAVRNDVEGKLVQAAFTKLLKDKSLKPIGVPDIEGMEEPRPEGEPLSFTLKFEVEPKVELGRYRGIDVEKPVFTLSDELVTRNIDSLQSRYAVYETIADAVAQDGDQAFITFVGTIDGEEFAGGKAENYPYILGSKRFFSEFETVLSGSKTGDSLACDVAFPDTYHAEHLRGKTAHFSITVNEIKRRQVPAWDDELAKQLGFESAEQGREKVKEQLRERLEEESREITEDRALKSVIESSTFTLPQTLVKTMANEVYEERVQELRSSRVPASVILEREHELRDAAQEQAIFTMKLWTVINEIAEAEGVEVTDEDFEQEASAMSVRTGIAVESVAKFLGDESRRGNYERRLLQRKVINVVLSNANVTEKETSPEAQTEGAE